MACLCGDCIDCLRAQLAQAERERDEAREVLESLEEECSDLRSHACDADSAFDKYGKMSDRLARILEAASKLSQRVWCANDVGCADISEEIWIAELINTVNAIARERAGEGE